MCACVSLSPSDPLKPVPKNSLVENVGSPNATTDTPPRGSDGLRAALARPRQWPGAPQPDAALHPRRGDHGLGHVPIDAVDDGLVAAQHMDWGLHHPLGVGLPQTRRGSPGAGGWESFGSDLGTGGTPTGLGVADWKGWRAGPCGFRNPCEVPTVASNLGAPICPGWPRPPNNRRWGGEPM